MENYLLYEMMANDVLVRKIMNGDALDAAYYLNRRRKSALLSRRQVGLRQVSRNDSLGIIAETGQKHFHLLGGRVLRLVENDERIVKRTSSHICQWRDLNDLLFHIALAILRSHKLKERVVKRTEIGVYLALKIARQKSELLPCLDSGSR